MKTKKLIFILVLSVLAVCSLVLWNALSIKHNYTVYFNPDLGFCFLVDERYTVKNSNDEFSYMGGKNSGEMKVHQRGLFDKSQKININGFKGSYRKAKNIRIYEYLINDGLVLEDRFVNADRGVVNLVPYRDECQAILEKHPNQIQIFTGDFK